MRTIRKLLRRFVVGCLNVITLVISNRYSIRSVFHNSEPSFVRADREAQGVGSRRYNGIKYQDVLDAVEKVDSKNFSRFSDVISFLSRNYELRDLARILQEYFSSKDLSGIHFEEDFAVLRLYYESLDYDRDQLELLEPKFLDWTVEPSESLYLISLCLKASFFARLHRRSKSIEILDEYFSITSDSQKNLYICELYLSYCAYFQDYRRIQALFSNGLISETKKLSPGLRARLIYPLLESFITSDNQIAFSRVYESIICDYQNAEDRQFLVKFENLYVEANINCFRFEEAKNKLGYFRHCVVARQYLRNWLNLARVEYFQGNLFRSRLLFLFVALVFGYKRLSIRDLKMLFGNRYILVRDYSRQSFKVIQSRLGVKAKGVEADEKAAQIYEQIISKEISRRNINHKQGQKYLSHLFSNDNYSGAKKVFEKLSMLPGFPWGNPYWHRRIRGLEYNSAREYFQTMADAATTVSLENNVENFVSQLPDCRNKKVLVLAHFGPGDEFIASSSYTALLNWARNNSNFITIATQRRILPLMRRTYPEINFIENERVIQGALNVAITDSSILNTGLPTTGLLSHVLDSRTQSKLSEYDYVTSTTLLIAQFHINNQHRNLQPDNARSVHWANKLKRLSNNDTRYFGLSWRSSLLTRNRNVHYFSTNELEPLKRISNAVFINLQLNVTDAELDELRAMGINIVNFDELDLFDDFDGMASLVSNLDGVISPFVAIGELAAAVGVKTFLLSPTMDTRWRVESADNDKEVVYSSGVVKVVFPSSNESKVSCIEVVAKDLQNL